LLEGQLSGEVAKPDGQRERSPRPRRPSQ
jgi:hypothetical protein